WRPTTGSRWRDSGATRAWASTPRSPRRGGWPSATISRSSDLPTATDDGEHARREVGVVRDRDRIRAHAGAVQGGTERDHTVEHTLRVGGGDGLVTAGRTGQIPPVDHEVEVR